VQDAALKQRNFPLFMTFLGAKFAKEIVRTGKELRSFSVFLSVAIKHFAISEEIIEI
jgi:hypothetical protein